MRSLPAIVFVLCQASSPQIPIPLEIRIPEYPDVAVKAQMAQVVEVEETINPDGTVASAAVLGKALPPLSAAALRAAREWKFSAGPANSMRKYVIRFEFTVDVDSASESGCWIGPQSVSISLPTQTVRIRGWLRSATTRVN
jgi:TonB family protein